MQFSDDFFLSSLRLGDATDCASQIARRSFTRGARGGIDRCAEILSRGFFSDFILACFGLPDRMEFVRPRNLAATRMDVHGLRPPPQLEMQPNKRLNMYVGRGHSL